MGVDVETLTPGDGEREDGGARGGGRYPLAKAVTLRLYNMTTRGLLVGCEAL